METFEETIREMIRERQKEEHAQYLCSLRKCENEIALFKCWCNAFKGGDGKDNAEVFAEYLKENDINLDFWVRKQIAEKYFGFKFEFDYKTMKWKKAIGENYGE